MRRLKPTHGLKSFSWTCCGLILSFGLTTLNLVTCGLGSSDASAGAVTIPFVLVLYHIHHFLMLVGIQVGVGAQGDFQVDCYRLAVRLFQNLYQNICGMKEMCVLQ